MKVLNDRTTEKEWRITYTYTGYGYALVSGATEEEAWDNYHDGNCQYNDTETDNYEADDIELVEE